MKTNKMYDYAMVTKIHALAGAATACSCLRPSRPVALQLASLEVEALQARTANPYWERRSLVGIVRPMKDTPSPMPLVGGGVGISIFQNVRAGVPTSLQLRRCLRPSRPVALQLASLEVEALQARTANPYWERRRLVGNVRPLEDTQQARASGLGFRSSRTVSRETQETARETRALHGEFAQGGSTFSQHVISERERCRRDKGLPLPLCHRTPGRFRA